MSGVWRDVPQSECKSLRPLRGIQPALWLMPMCLAPFNIMGRSYSMSESESPYRSQAWQDILIPSPPIQQFIGTSCRPGQSHAAATYTRVCGTCIVLKCGGEARAQHVQLHPVLYSIYSRVPFMGPGTRFLRRIPEAGAETRPRTTERSNVFPLVFSCMRCCTTTAWQGSK